MRTFNDAINQIENELSEFSYEKTHQDNSKAEFRVHILDEEVNILLLTTSLTGSDRTKPQIRVFTKRILEKMNESLDNNERFFCLVHCKHDEVALKFNNIEPYNYIVSLESDWSNAAGRIDIRSIYDYIEDNHTINYKKLNKSQHSARSIIQATIFKQTVDGFENFRQYLSFFDSRLIHQVHDVPDNVDNRETEATLINVGLNKIYFGAPGTGKSYGIQKFIRENGIPEFDEKSSHPNVFRTTLHPEFTYYDFVGQVMPEVRSIGNDSDETKIEYNFVPNIFTKALTYALSEGVRDSQPVFLILEEMSRANVAAVFGDLFQLLDRDPVTGESEYKINNDLISKYIFNDDRQIYIPKNLFLIGTVNTNDQNVFVMDTAFKRRFEFEYINANTIALSDSDQPLNNYRFSLKYNDEEEQVFDWITFYRALNRFITKKVENGGLGLKEDKQLGQFFIKFRSGDETFNFNQIKGKLLQYLYDDVEAVAYASTSIFSQEISSFGEAYIKISEKENIFSSEFINEYQTLEKIDS
ncbi:AAA family ATPase [Bacillus sp. JCM 19034]|uniref:AAA family ATPase n=1 Tax=Bacillus sp. JCM 19034 TaxID=1481928 RepID=UPI00078494EB|nr:AAA family ATPase [Bacillus sp. JCM 19034]